MRNVKALLGILFLVLTMAACSSDDSGSNNGNNQLRIKASAVYSPTANRSANGAAINENVILTSFKINIKEIEFEFAEDYYDDNDNDDDDDNDGYDDDDNSYDDDGFYGDDDEFELSGPFELDLLNQSSVVTTVTIPNGIYEEVEFKLDKNNNSSSEMFNKSIEIKGTIGGIPFVFWHNVEEDFEIDYEDTNQNLVVNNGSYELVFNFNLNQVLSQVDISNATDGNGDGLIEISPNDSDGNQSLANVIKNKIKESCDLDD